MLKFLIGLSFSTLLFTSCYATNDSSPALSNDTSMLIAKRLHSVDAKNLGMTCRQFNQAVAKRENLALSHEFFTQAADDTNRAHILKFLNKVKDTKRLRIYVLPRSKEVNLAVFRILCEHFGSLHELDISYYVECFGHHTGASRLGSIDLFLAKNPKLESISVEIPFIKDMITFVRDLVDLSEEAPIAMALIENFDRLGLTSDTITVLRSTPNLKQLSLDNLETLTIEVLEAIAKSCPRLERFCLQGAYQISTRHILKLMKDCPGLTIVDQTILKTLDLESIRSNDAICPGMDVLNIIQGTTNRQLAKDVNELCCGNLFTSPCQCFGLARTVHYHNKVLPNCHEPFFYKLKE